MTRSSRPASSNRGSASLYGDLHIRITCGKSAPGERLPTCRQLATHYQVSPMTAQRALDRLVAQGFAVARGMHGTFVADYPPHLFRYGIVFPSDPQGGETNWWPPAWEAMDQQARRLRSVDPRREIVPYYNITGHSDVEDYQRLIDDLDSGRLAGLIFASPKSEALREAPLFADPKLPRVIVQSQGVPGRAVGFDIDRWRPLNRALDWFASRGRRRVAILHLPSSAILDEARTVPLVEARGMQTRPYWLLPVNHQTPETAAPIVRLLMSGPARQRPDALFVANPFMVEAATAGLRASGVDIPRDLDVLAAANFPLVSKTHVPVRWFGTDIRELICRAVESIDALRSGKSGASAMEYEQVFEEELATEDPFTRLLAGGPCTVRSKAT